MAEVIDPARCEVPPDRPRPPGDEERRRWILGSLARPAAYPGTVEEVGILETPDSVIFFAGPRVYKLKHAADGLAAGSVEERRGLCEEEVRLNRRLASAVYAGVVPITSDERGELTIRGLGTPVEWMVEMARLSPAHRLDTLLARDELDEGEVERLALVLARFHDRAMTGPSVNRHGLPRTVTERTRAALARLERALALFPGALAHGGLRRLRAEAERFLETNRDLLERRVADWRIRDGHGDLRPENVHFLGEEIAVVGCIQHDRRRRYGDVASDLALLAMGLDHMGRAQEAELLVRTYAGISVDSDLERLITFYKAHHAVVAAEVALLAAGDGCGGDASSSRAAEREATRLLQLALGYVLPPCLVLVSAPEARARDAVAGEVAVCLRAPLLRADGGGNGDGAVPAVVREAEDALRQGGSVVIDGPFDQPRGRRAFLELAGDLDVPGYVLAADDAQAHDAEDEALARWTRGASPEAACTALLERMLAADPPPAT